MKNKDDKNNYAGVTYRLSPEQLSLLHKQYGLPGEMAPGVPAKRKRNRFDRALSQLDRRDREGVMPLTEDLPGSDIQV